MRPSSRWSAQSKPRGIWRKVKVAALAFFILVLTGSTLALVFLFYHPYASPRFLPLVVDEYRHDVPLRPWARRDAVALQQLATWRNRPESLTSQSSSLLRDNLDQLKLADPKVPLVVYLSAYIVPDEKGEPLLLPADVRPDEKSKKTPLADALQRIAECPASHKLLLLDVMQPLVMPAEGLVRSNAADLALPRLRQAVEDYPGLLILTACSPGQVSRTSEELGHSVFAYFVLEGLRGRGRSGAAEARIDGRVTAHKLAAFVTDRVDSWANHNLLTRQTPKLLGDAKDFTLASILEEQDEDEALPNQYPAWLLKGWQLRDQLWDKGAHRRSPKLYATLERELLLQERRWRGGLDEERIKKDLEAHLSRLGRQIHQALPAAGPHTPTSLAEARAASDDAEAATELRQLLDRRDALARQKPDEASLKLFETDLKGQTKRFEKKPAALAALACDLAGDYPFGPDALAVLGGLFHNSDVASFDEVAFLSRLADRAKKAGSNYSAEVAQYAMRTARKAALAGTISPEVVPWVSDQLDRAERARKSAEALLNRTDKPWDDTAKKAYRDAHELYDELTRDAALIDEAQRCRDDAQAMLPTYLGALEIDDSHSQAWRIAATAARDLTRALETPITHPGRERDERLGQIQQLNLALREDPRSFGMLRRQVKAVRIPAANEQRKENRAADCKSWQVFLATPWPTAGQRLKLWEAHRASSRLLHEEWQENQTASNSKRQERRPWDDQAAKDGRNGLLRHDLLRARCEFLRRQLLAPNDLAELGQAIDETERHLDGPEQWAKVRELMKKTSAGPKVQDNR